MAKPKDPLAGATNVNTDVAKKLQKIIELQNKQIEGAKRLGIEGQLLNALKEKQISKQKMLDVLETSIGKKYEKVLKIQEAIDKRMARGLAATKNQSDALKKYLPQIESAKNLYSELTKEVHTISTLLTKLGLGKLVDGTKELIQLWKNPLYVAITLLFFYWKSVLSVFKDMDEAAAKFRMELGAIRTTSGHIDEMARSIAFEFGHLGVNADIAYTSVVELSKALGSSAYLSKELTSNVSLMSAQLGVAQSTSAEFVKNMAILDRSTSGLKSNTLLFAAALSDAAGTPLKEIMGDISNATRNFYSYVSRSSLALIKAAVEAKRMGTTLESSAKSSTNLLKFTQSVKDEMEASVLLGEAINLQRARELSYRRDLAGLNKEIYRILKETNFETLDPFQQESVAHALGKSASELSNMAQSKRQMEEMERSTVPAIQKQLAAYKSMTAFTEARAEAEAKNLQTQLRTQSNQAAIASITASWNAIIARLAEFWLPKIEKVLRVVSSILSMGNVQWAGWLSGAIGVAAAVGTVVATFMLLSKSLGIMGAAGRGLAGAGSGGGIFGGLAKGVSAMGNPKVLAGAAAILILSASMIPLAYALKLMNDVNWKSVGIMAVGLTLLTAAALALGALMASGIGAVALLAGAAAIAILGAAMIPFAYAGKIAAGAMKMLNDVNWADISKGIFAIGIQSPLIAAMGVSMLIATPGIIAFSLALVAFSFAANRAGSAMNNLGGGFKLVVDSIERLQNLSLVGTIMQVRDLSKAVIELSKVLQAMPEIEVRKLERIGVAGAGAATPVAPTPSNEGVIKGLQDIQKELQMLRQDLGSGKLRASTSIDGQKVDATVGRTLEFRGTLA